MLNFLCKVVIATPLAIVGLTIGSAMNQAGDASKDVAILRVPDRGIQPQVDMCPMSSEAFAQGPKGSVVGAWETDGQVYFAHLDPTTGKHSDPVAAPGPAVARKHPALAVNASGAMLFAWTEGMGWNRGGTAVWQIYDRSGKPTDVRGRAPGVPVWSLVAAFVRPDGSFVVVY
jgi:hypothetical protein